MASFDKEPTFKSNLLIYEGHYYLIGEEHKEFTADKMADSDYGRAVEPQQILLDYQHTLMRPILFSEAFLLLGAAVIDSMTRS